ncbi:CYTH domain-containing protein [Dokdonia sp. Hel_I_53]|uniref:CYTH domain-containing protein n=1 Tax=Dokdonia sp. Hel_I_53 TaxID=1566287 RepID=UPI0011998492|nr:CYTH domain-containing protein [Dokdonia sp. Hel_I_53]TVZ52887.1 adenylate cyclase [Dokdonia sp. Hel_I_53]
MLEIERKFLVISDAFKEEAQVTTRITQGYLSVDPERTVRVRIKGDKGYLTIKGKSSSSGMSRIEVEEEIIIPKAEQLLKLSLPGVIDKTRYEIPAGKHLWEVDIFYGENNGLILAEIELTAEDEHFEKPSWLGKEVTGDIRYYNAQLSKHPYTRW